MDQNASDFELARTHMVESQVRPNRVNDPKILEAMRSLPRERFVPPEQAALAYADADVSLGEGRVLLAPMLLARLVQLAEPRAGERALVVGAGTGYGAAVLAECGAVVTALEEDRRLLALARELLPSLAPSVRVVEGPLAAGWPADGPWHIVLIEGAVRAIPSALAGQIVRQNGRLVAVLAPSRGTSRAVLGRPSAGRVALQGVFDCATSLLPSLAPAPEFTF
ncbi:MAG: protein-L-isoaspartate O-methyltransferase [Rhodospirillales bacterium]|nr:protein-L-isoaspartate O-methyltransferase [Rhodospirillales bacterium]